MTDRELLDLAAKAAGYKINAHIEGDGCWICKPGAAPNLHGDFPFVVWRPLEDDGDALRLAVKLGFEVRSDLIEKKCIVRYSANGSITSYWHWHENQGPDAAMRRAIVRAAADAGEDMP